MDVILRGLFVYVMLFLLMRISGKRTFAEINTFDFVLILIIAETTQQALLGEDFSVTNAALLIITLLTIDIGLSLAKQKWPRLGRWLDGTPVVLIDQGKLLREQMNWTRISEEDILQAARQGQGILQLDQIEYAVLEQTGSISIIPKQ